MTEAAAEENLTAFVTSTVWEDIPSEVGDIVLRSIADTLAVSVRAAWLADSTPLLDAARELGSGDGTGVVIGRPERFGRQQAALLNGAFAHSMDFDDTNSDAFVHPTASVLGVAIALADHGDRSGPRLLKAVCVGLEVCCRVGAALGRGTYERGFHPTAIAGVMGAVATASALLDLDDAGTADAFGLAGSVAAGSMQYLANGAWNKRLHPGLMAQAALQATSLASHGVRGAAEPITGVHGLLRAYSPDPDPSGLTDGLGTTWRTMRTAIKPYPSCRLTHGATDAARIVGEAFGDGIGDVRTITIGLPPEAVPIVVPSDRRTTRPSNVVDAQFSVLAQVAFALRDGTVTWDSYERIDDPAVLALIDRMEVQADDTMPRGGGWVAVVTTSGRTYEETCQRPRGSVEVPLTSAELREKFDALTQAILGDDGSARLWDRVLELPSAPSLDGLLGELTPDKAPAVGGRR